MIKGIQQMVEELGYLVVQPMRPSEDQLAFILSDGSWVIVSQISEEYDVSYLMDMTEIPDYELLNRINMATNHGKHVIKKGSITKKQCPVYIFSERKAIKKMTEMKEALQEVLEAGRTGYRIINTPQEGAEIPEI